MAILQVNGPEVTSVFQNEAGCHRWQHAPTGRVHTSTLTIAVLSEPTPQELIINPNDLRMTTCRGAGKGGQNRNKLETAVQILHLPTNIMVRCEAERSQHQNKELAIKTLRARLWQHMQEEAHKTQSQLRNSQIGSGERRRTIQVQHNIVKDHITGNKWRYEDYRCGKWRV